jgi:hypothetical protein
MKAYLIANISSKGPTHIGLPDQKFQSFEKKKCFFFHRVTMNTVNRGGFAQGGVKLHRA